MTIRRDVRVAGLLGLTGLAAAVAASAAVPTGPEFQVNTYTTNIQTIARVASDAAGNFVVVWQSEGSAGTDKSSTSIQGQRYDSSGSAVGGQFQVNTYTTNFQQGASVVADPAGNFVVVWHSRSSPSDSSASSVHGQRYGASGSPIGGEFQVNTYTTGSQDSPWVASDSAGNFVIVWRSLGSAGTDTGSYSVQGQRYQADGSPIGGEFQVNTYTTNHQFSPSVSSDSAGNFVVVWWSQGSAGTDTSGDSVQGQRYDAAGIPLGAQFQVNTYTTQNQTQPSVASGAAGDFVVVWTSAGSAGSDTFLYSIQGQRFDANGAPVDAQFQVNTYTTWVQSGPSIARDAAGDFVVTWHNDGHDGSSWEIRGQTFDASGSPTGGEFQVNTYTNYDQTFPAVASDAAGEKFVVVWDSRGSSGTDQSEFSIQARRYLTEPDSVVSLGAIGAMLLALAPMRRQHPR